MPPSSETRRSLSTQSASRPEYIRDERVQLLRLAHEAILSALERREMAECEPSSHLSELRGAFTTLHLVQRLRGCVGYPNAIVPLYRTVVQTARAAAFDDPRFAPLTLTEAREVRVSLSVLSPLEPILAEEVEVGRHGLVVSLNGYRGLLLPQVPVEHGWNRVTFLEQTCRKAGLPTNAWREGEGAIIEAFTAEVFRDEDPER